MSKRTFMYHKGIMVLNTINQLIVKGHRIVTSKTIRILNNIAESDRTTINFIWLNLDFLCDKGFIKLIKTTPIKKFELPKEPIEIEELILLDVI